MFRSKSVKKFSYSKSKYIQYHPKFRPLIERKAHKNLGSHHDIGLVFRRQHLRFVSCHEEKIHWFHQLKELVTVFDIYTWIFLVLFSLAISKMMRFVCKCANFRNVKSFPILSI